MLGVDCDILECKWSQFSIYVLSYSLGQWVTKVLNFLNVKNLLQNVENGPWVGDHPCWYCWSASRMLIDIDVSNNFNICDILFWWLIKEHTCNQVWGLYVPCCWVWASVCICLPRIYFIWHYQLWCFEVYSSGLMNSNLSETSKLCWALWCEDAN